MSFLCFMPNSFQAQFIYSHYLLRVLLYLWKKKIVSHLELPYSWSHDCEAVLEGKRFWMFLTPQDMHSDTSTESAKIDQDVEKSWRRKEAQRRELESSYILAAVVDSCKSLIREERCPRVAWALLLETF